MLVVDAIAVHRLTRLVTADVVTKDLRGRVIAWAYRTHRTGVSIGFQADATDFGTKVDWDQVVALDDNAPKLATLVTCRWCSSVYVAFGVIVVRRFRWWAPVRDALALSSASTLLARLESE